MKSYFLGEYQHFYKCFFFVSTAVIQDIPCLISWPNFLFNLRIQYAAVAEKTLDYSIFLILSYIKSSITGIIQSWCIEFMSFRHRRSKSTYYSHNTEVLKQVQCSLFRDDLYIFLCLHDRKHFLIRLISMDFTFMLQKLYLFTSTNFGST